MNTHLVNPASESCTLLPRCVTQLNRIVASVPRLGVVLSSAWRYMILGRAMTLQGFHHMLRTHGVSKDLLLVGHTVADEKIAGRGRQIEAWMVEACRGRDVESYAVLDDADNLDFTPVWHRLVKTDGTVGLTAERADLVIGMLGRD